MKGKGCEWKEWMGKKVINVQIDGGFNLFTLAPEKHIFTKVHAHSAMEWFSLMDIDFSLLLFFVFLFFVLVSFYFF